MKFVMRAREVGSCNAGDSYSRSRGGSTKLAHVGLFLQHESTLRRQHRLVPRQQTLLRSRLRAVLTRRHFLYDDVIVDVVVCTIASGESLSNKMSLYESGKYNKHSQTC